MYYYPANTGAFLLLLLVVLLGKLDELTLSHVVAKPKSLLTHARAGLDSRPTWGSLHSVPRSP